MSNSSWPTSEQHSAGNMMAAVMGVVERGVFTNGPEVEKLEHEFGDYLRGADGEMPYVVAVNSGTAALTAILVEAGIGPGHEVIVPALSFTATALAVLHAGARPVFVDVDETWSIDISRLEGALTNDTRAVLAVDLHGMPADWAALGGFCLKEGLDLFEDACPAYGASYLGEPCGLFGRAAAFSLNQSKMLSAGEGGLVVTRDPEVAERIRELRNFGELLKPGEQHRYSVFVGWNWKMPELTAAVARISLTDLPITVARGRRNVEIIERGLVAGGVFQRALRTFGAEPSWHKYRARVNAGLSREAAEELLTVYEVPFSPVDVVPLPSHPAFYGRSAYSGGFSNAMRALSHSVVLGTRERPIFAISTDEAERWAVALGGLRMEKAV